MGGSSGSFGAKNDETSKAQGENQGQNPREGGSSIEWNAIKWRRLDLIKAVAAAVVYQHR